MLRHPNADLIRLALVDVPRLGRLHIVFGGPDIVGVGDLVPVAPPGSRVPSSGRKMRTRSYRGERSQGMLCSLVELGWAVAGPDEVVLFTPDLAAGQALDELTAPKRHEYVRNCEWTPPHRIEWSAPFEVVPMRTMSPTRQLSEALVG